MLRDLGSEVAKNAGLKLEMFFPEEGEFLNLGLRVLFQGSSAYQLFL